MSLKGITEIYIYTKRDECSTTTECSAVENDAIGLVALINVINYD